MALASTGGALPLGLVMPPPAAECTAAMTFLQAALGCALPTALLLRIEGWQGSGGSIPLPSCCGSAPGPPRWLARLWADCTDAGGAEEHLDEGMMVLGVAKAWISCCIMWLLCVAFCR